MPACLHHNCLSRGSCALYRPPTTRRGRISSNDRTYSPWKSYKLEYVDGECVSRQTILPEARPMLRTWIEVKGNLSSMFNKCHEYAHLNRTHLEYFQRTNLESITLYEIEQADFD